MRGGGGGRKVYRFGCRWCRNTWNVQPLLLHGWGFGLKGYWYRNRIVLPVQWSTAHIGHQNAMTADCLAGDPDSLGYYGGGGGTNKIREWILWKQLNFYQVSAKLDGADTRGGVALRCFFSMAGNIVYTQHTIFRSWEDGVAMQRDFTHPNKKRKKG